MLSPSYSISPKDLWNTIATRDALHLIDVRRPDAYEQSPHLLPGAVWRDAAKAAQWASEFEHPIVVACKAGHELSQSTVAQLRADGIDARILEGGYEAWAKAGLPFVAKAELDRIARRPSIWVTRRRPKIDRIACPWLIRRFVDPTAVFLFVAPMEVKGTAERFGGAPFDVEDTFWSHRGETCTFDTMLAEFGLATEPLGRLARIVRGADTSRLDLAPEAPGLLAASLGLSRMYADDLEQLEAGMTVYDAFYRWCRDATEETHNWPTNKPKP
jgi:rhodanese-related sulfurtransferase